MVCKIIYKNIKNICKEKRIVIYKMLTDLELSHNFMYSLTKNEKTDINSVIKIATYLSVSINELIYERNYSNMTEHDIQNLIRLKLTELGYTVFRPNVGKVKMADGRWFDTGLPKGFSDLIAIKNGRIAFLEVKTETGKASVEQLNFIQQMQAKGCIAGIVRSVEETKELLNENY